MKKYVFAFLIIMLVFSGRVIAELFLRCFPNENSTAVCEYQEFVVNEIDEAKFDAEVMKTSLNQVVIVMFWSPLDNCELLKHIQVELLNNWYYYGNSIKYVKLNRQKSKKICQKWGIHELPCLVSFSNGAILRMIYPENIEKLNNERIQKQDHIQEIVDFYNQKNPDGSPKYPYWNDPVFSSVMRSIAEKFDENGYVVNYEELYRLAKNQVCELAYTIIQKTANQKEETV
jgi:thioredoxin-like negative regulator of GroEL